jgi:hypothetical protein
MNRSSVGLRVALALAASAVVLACSSSKTGDGGSSGSTGAQSTAAAVAGAADTHCAALPVVVVDPSICHAAADPDAGHDHDAGDVDAGAPVEESAPVLFGSEGDDDDCKYHVKWTSSPVAKDTDVTLAVVTTYRSDSKPVTGAAPYAEIFLDDTHPGPNTAVKTTETSPGSYTIGPVRFDASGKWTVRFHFSADCTDAVSSPHGHVAFFVNVP